MNKLKKGDEVIVRTGKNKNQRGKILRLLGVDRAIVEGVAVVKRHTRPNPQIGVSGGIISKEAAVQLANLAYYNVAAKKADRLGVRTLKDGKKVRVFKSSGETVDA